MWPDLGKGWKPEQLYFFHFTTTKTPGFYVDITGDAVAKKSDAFRQMKSQLSDAESKGIQAYFELLGARVASQAGLPPGKFAEAFDYILW